MTAPWQGSIVALVSPMHDDGALDRQSLQGLIEWHVESGTAALVIAGTTGESATLTHEENLDIVSWALEAADGRIPIIAGTGSNNTAEALHLTREARRRGAQGCLLVTPYYNKPTQQGLELHYREIASQVDVPIILYNVPHRTGIDMLPETVEKLSKIDNIVAIKEAGSSPERVKDIIERCGDSIAVYGGEDPISLEAMLRGAQGVISVTANVDPAGVKQLCLHALAGRESEARRRRRAAGHPQRGPLLPEQPHSRQMGPAAAGAHRERHPSAAGLAGRRIPQPRTQSIERQRMPARLIPRPTQGRWLPPLLIAATLLGGCSSSSPDTDYLFLDYAEALQAPPEIGDLAAAETQITVPEEPANQVDLLPRIDRLRLVRDGRLSWLAIASEAEKVWPLLKQFLRKEGFVAAEENRALGMLSTNWRKQQTQLPKSGLARLFSFLSSALSAERRERYTLYLERGERNRSSRVFVQYTGMIYTSEQDQTSNAQARGEVAPRSWQTRPSDPMRESQFLQKLMIHLGVERQAALEAAAEPAAAVKRHTSVRPRLRQRGGTLALEIVGDKRFIRHLIPGALLDAGFALEEERRQEGLIRVSWNGGSLKNLNRPFSERIFSRRSTSYDIRIDDSKNPLELRVLGETNSPLKAADQRLILEALAGSLS